MKKTTLTIIGMIVIVLLAYHPVTAQLLFTDSDRPIHVGIKAGVNQFTLQGSNKEDIGEKSGIQFGLFLLRGGILDDWVSNSENLKMRLEINYLRKTNDIFDNRMNRVMYDGVELFLDEDLHGFKLDRSIGNPFIDDEIFDENVYSSVTFHFIEAPLRFIYELPIGLVAPYALAGSTFSVVMDYDHTFTLITEDGVQYTQSGITERVNQHYSKINFSADIGFGIRLPYGLFMEGHYSHGLTNTMKFYKNNMFQRGFVANFGIQF